MISSEGRGFAGRVVDLRIRPEWKALDATWDACRAALGGAGVSADEAYALAMVAQELLENAVKYGADGPREEIHLAIEVSPEEVTVEVKSRVGVDGAHLRRFDETIQWIRGFQDPFEAYVERLKLVSAQPYAHGKSGLGLTRIACEGRCVLDFYVNETNTLAVSAVYQREDAEGAWAATS